MRKFVVILTVLILAFIIAACGNDAQARRETLTKVEAQTTCHLV